MDQNHLRLAASHIVIALTGLKAHELSKPDVDAVTTYLEYAIPHDHVSELICKDAMAPKTNSTK